MGSPAFDNSVTDLESFCAQLGTVIGALGTALPDLQADAQGFDKLLPPLRDEFDGAETAAGALHTGVESKAASAGDAVQQLTHEAESWDGTAEKIGEAAAALDEEAGGELAEHARQIETGVQELWSGAWAALRTGVEHTASDLARWTDEAGVSFDSVQRSLEEAAEAVAHEKDDTLAMLTHAAQSTHEADVGLEGLRLHPALVEDELQEAFGAQGESVESLMAEWGRWLEGEATVTRSAVETLGMDGQNAVATQHARLAAALEALAGELERMDMELSQTAAEAAGGRDRAEQVGALERDLDRTEARVAEIRALMASFEPT